MVNFFLIFVSLSFLFQSCYSDLLDQSDCNSKFGCFYNPKNCKNNTCEYIAKWRESNNQIEFLIGSPFGKLQTMWLAIAFSDDQSMGNDSVVMCKYGSQTDVKLENRFNADQSEPELLDETNSSQGLADIKISNEQGFLTCSFKREKTNTKIKNFFDLKQDFFLLIAKGEFDSESGISYHGKHKVVSHNKINFGKTLEVKSISTSTDLIKFHAILMVIAWSFMSTTGILFARYYKYIFPKIKFGGVQFWFTVHRSFMASVCVVSLAGFIVIFGYKNWKWVDSSSKVNFAHSITGIVTIGLSLIQPIMAFFRPDKTAPTRPLFNWSHRFVGLASYFCSIAAIFLGVIIYVENYHWIALVSWIVWLVILVIALEVIDYRMISTDKVQNTENGGLNIEKEQKEKSNLKSYFMILHLIFSIGWTLSLILAILELF